MEGCPHPVAFVVTLTLAHPPRAVWDELIDWEGHANWVPLTRVEVESDDPQSIGAVFTAWTGVGPLTLEDRMEVTELTWNDETNEGYCEVKKLGPMLSGMACFRVSPSTRPGHAEVTWTEDVVVAALPKFLGPPATWGSSLGFRLIIRRLATTI